MTTQDTTCIKQKTRSEILSSSKKILEKFGSVRLKNINTS